MYTISVYSMLAAISSTMMLSIIFLILAHQNKKNYMRLWGISWLMCSLLFSLDFINLSQDLLFSGYIMFRQMIMLLTSYLFLLGTFRFFQIKFYDFISILTVISTCSMVCYPLSDKFIAIALIPNIIVCSGMLIAAGCMFISMSWTQVMPEKIFASSLILIWSIYINHFGFSLKNESLAAAAYVISIITVNLLMIVLIIVYFKKLRFTDSVTSSRYKLLVENSSDSMFLYDYGKQAFEYVSSSIKTLIGVSHIQLYDMPERFFDYIAVDSDEKHLLKIFAAPVARPGSGMLNYYRNNTQRKWVEIHYIPIWDNAHTVTAVEGILRDCTIRKKTEENLKATEEAKKEFLENISHEIKTPVTLIQGYAESILDKVIPEDMSETYLKLINQKAGMLTTLVDDLSQAANYTSQNLQYKFYEQKATDMFTDLLLQSEFQITSAGIKAVIYSDISEHAMLIADAYRIQQVVSNIINNAIRHTPADNEVFISCSTKFNPDLSAAIDRLDRAESDFPAGELVFTVSDTGDGIPEAFLPHIFERSFSEKQRKPNEKSGLGLFISRQIISQHSGNIYACNKKSGGAEITFTLPCYQI